MHDCDIVVDVIVVVDTTSIPCCVTDNGVGCVVVVLGIKDGPLVVVCADELLEVVCILGDRTLCVVVNGTSATVVL